MLDRLPVELLTLILREACPLPTDTTSYRGRALARHRELKNLSLVCHRLSGVAQRMLPELLIPRDEEARAILDGRADGKAVRHLSFDSDALSDTMWDALLQASPNDWSTSPSTGSSFSTRKHLTFPGSLRHLALSSLCTVEAVAGALHPSHLQLSNPLDRLRRLELFIFDVSEPFHLDVPFDSSCLVLLHCSVIGGLCTLFDLYPARLPPHLFLEIQGGNQDRLETWNDEEADYILEDVGILADRIASASSTQESLKLLVLPPHTLDAYMGGGLVDTAIRRLVAVCEEKGVEVTFEDSTSWLCGSMITAERREMSC
ncbi:hypothetical protein JCM6882_001823 [Rhodosporidiobolus microsporus]